MQLSADEANASKERKLLAFNTAHHPTFRGSYARKLQWWARETTVNFERCPRCWLRARDCYCTQLSAMREKHECALQDCNGAESSISLQILIYYDPPEIGRSPNTAHVFQAIAPGGLCESMLYGDYAREKQLIDEIEQEIRSGYTCSTCIMYPSSGAMLLSDWVRQWKQSHLRSSHSDNSSNSSSNSSDSSGSSESNSEGGSSSYNLNSSLNPVSPSPTTRKKTMRLVLLDGTFPGASRQVKYLVNCCRLRGFELPQVKLDLDGGYCKSAITGVMTQPGKEKICSFQAMIMALEQIDPRRYSGMCTAMRRDLNDWLAYILRSRIKMGKSNPRKSLQSVCDNTPDPYLQEIIVRRQ